MASSKLNMSRPVMITMGCMIVLTIVFDSILIAMGFYSYNPAKLMGVYVGYAPVEDLFYIGIAVLVTSSIWKWMEVRSERDS
jgi:lycopene cyclase domain-containing protein